MQIDLTKVKFVHFFDMTLNCIQVVYDSITERFYTPGPKTNYFLIIFCFLINNLSFTNFSKQKFIVVEGILMDFKIIILK